MFTVSNTDLSRMQTLGRLTVVMYDQAALEEAAEYLAVAKLEDAKNDTSNYTRLWIWFEEGARNYVGSQRRLNVLQEQLRARVDQLYRESTKPQLHQAYRKAV